MYRKCDSFRNEIQPANSLKTKLGNQKILTFKFKLLHLSIRLTSQGLYTRNKILKSRLPSHPHRPPCRLPSPSHHSPHHSKIEPQDAHPLRLQTTSARGECHDARVFASSGVRAVWGTAGSAGFEFQARFRKRGCRAGGGIGAEVALGYWVWRWVCQGGGVV